MTIEFKGEQIFLEERRTLKPYIGYFSPSGELIGLSLWLNKRPTHNTCLANDMSYSFLQFISFIIEGTSVTKLKTLPIANPNIIRYNEYPGIDEGVKRGVRIYSRSEYDGEYEFDTQFMSLDNLNHSSFNHFLADLYDKIDQFDYIRKEYKLLPLDKFEYDLLMFFKNAYKNKSFFETIQRRIIVKSHNMENISPSTYKNLYKSIPGYYDSWITALLSYAKDIYVQYLGYDSLERFNPNGYEIKIPSQYEYDNFLHIPRIITSTYPNTNERYFNALIMNWVVHRVPRYYYNETSEQFEEDSFFLFYQSENEQKLEKEIQSIKRLVPLKERYKYFI